MTTMGYSLSNYFCQLQQEITLKEVLKYWQSHLDTMYILISNLLSEQPLTALVWHKNALEQVLDFQYILIQYNSRSFLSKSMLTFDLTGPQESE